MDSRIFLIGFMGSGKSTIGRKLARKIAYDFVDMDQLIEETAGMTIPGIFQEHGERVFRKWEHDILLELCQREKLVIATGGGAPCHGQMMETMNSCGTTVYIQMSPAALQERLIPSSTERPLIKGKSPEELLEFIHTKLQEREAFYNKADFILDGLHLSPDTLSEILERA